jgi:hypothetical protein
MTRYDKKVRNIQDGGHFRFAYISESMPNSEKVLKQKVSQMTRYVQKMFEKSKMAATSGLAISRNLCRIAESFETKSVLNDKIWLFFFEKSKMAATSSLAISRYLYRIAI